MTIDFPSRNKHGNFDIREAYKLDYIFEKQRALQDKLGITEFNQEFINLQILALQVELVEVLNETRWKNPAFVKHGWKLSQIMNKEKAQEELADCLHFFINLCLALDLDAEQLYELYMNKNKTNIKRKEDGY